MNADPHTCLFAIDGFERIFEGAEGLSYDREDGINVLLSGPAGAGKTLLALQMAVTAAIRSRETKGPGKPPNYHKSVIYLTKDTPPATLARRMCHDFRLFGYASKQAARSLNAIRLLVNDKNGKRRTRRALNAILRKRAGIDTEQAARRELLETTSLCGIALESKRWGRPVQVPERLRILLLDNLISNAVTLFGEEADDEIKRFLDGLGNGGTSDSPIFAIGDLNLACTPPAEFDRSMVQGPMLRNLWHLCPNLRIVFDHIAGGRERPCPRWWEDLMIAIDSLPPSYMEQCLRVQAERPRGQEADKTLRHPFNLFVSEVPGLDANVEATYPPDVHICLGLAERDYCATIKTIQVQKARFHRVRHEPFPFVIVGTGGKVGQAEHFPVADIIEGHPPRTTRSDPDTFETRPPGITILPSMSDAATCRQDIPNRPSQDIVFGTTALDSMTLEKKLAGGGCTLLVTENRCHSTVLGLHYLLGAIGRFLDDRDQGRAADEEERFGQIPRSVLYVAADTDLPGILHDVWRYPLLRRAIWDDRGSDLSPRESWESIEAKIRQSLSPVPGEVRTSGERHRLYKIPLQHGKKHTADRKGECSHYGPYLYILIPDLAWSIPEEVVERIEQLLQYESHRGGCGLESPDGCCIRIDRILLNRVSRVKARWPLVEDVNVFVSNIAQVCRSHQIELMIIDDTYYETNIPRQHYSEWLSIAQNMIRLKRVPFHAGEAVAMELVRSHGRTPSSHRPQELYSHHLVSVETAKPGAPLFPQQELRSRDSFRGFTGLFTGNPQHCRVVVDLVYDSKDTPLYRDAQNTARNLKTLMDGVEVHVRGPDERPGINSALTHLSSVSHDTCHVAAIDEVWLHRIIGTVDESSGLAELTGEELKRALPRHIRRQIKEQTGERKDEGTDATGQATYTDLGDSQMADDPIFVYSVVKQQYATEAMTISCRKAGKAESVYAVPYWNNWGVLAMSLPRTGALRELLDDVVQFVSSKVRTVEQLMGEKADSPEIARWGGDAVRVLAGLLLKQENWFEDVETTVEVDGGRIPVREAAMNVFRSLWSTPARDPDRPEEPVKPVRPPTWLDLRAVKAHIWDRVANSPAVRDIARVLSEREKHRTRDRTGTMLHAVEAWLSPTTTVHFFDIHRDTTESPVTFFLELLLAHADWKTLFEEKGDPEHVANRNYSTALLLHVRTDTDAQQAAVHALRILHGLLDPCQRREMGIGLMRRSARHVPAARTVGEMESTEHIDPRFNYPASYSLLAREWLSTIPDVGARRDIRERIVLRHLPAANDNTDENSERMYRTIVGSPAAETAAYPDEILGIVKEAEKKAWKKELHEMCENVGPTLSGTWYLGALSGGNLDVACDVIRELVSDYHERDRVISGGAGPVTVPFYTEGMISKPDDPEHFIPYADIISRYLRERRWRENATMAKSDKDPSFVSRPTSLPTFPFCRSRIREYTSISLELTELIRHAMQIHPPSRDADGVLDAEDNDRFGEQLETLVKGSYERIARLNKRHSPARSRHPDPAFPEPETEATAPTATAPAAEVS